MIVQIIGRWWEHYVSLWGEANCRLTYGHPFVTILYGNVNFISIDSLFREEACLSRKNIADMASKAQDVATILQM